MAVTLQKARGALALVGSLIDEHAKTSLGSEFLRSHQFSPAPLPYHITLLTKEELRGLSEQQIAAIKLDTRHIFPVGIGGTPNAGVFWIVVIWAAGQLIRKLVGLAPKHFHITLSGEDNHNMDKGIVSLFPGQFPEAPSTDLLDHLTFTLHAMGQYQHAQEYGAKIILRDPASHKGFLRLADAAFLDKQYKVAMLSYAQAYECEPEDKVRSYCLKRLFDCSREAEWGAVCQEHEIARLRSLGAITNYLLSPWSTSLREALAEQPPVPSLLLESRQPLFVPENGASPGKLAFYKLPRFFRWLIPFHLAIMSTPRNEDDITALAAPHLGIRHVLTLTEESPLRESWFHRKPITNTFLPIPNYHPPSIEQMDIIIRLFDNDKKLPLLVHCGGGKGRAGTVAACYLAAFGFCKPQCDQDHPEIPAAEAISLLRSLRPGSLETSQQEDFVSKWCSTIWKRQSIYPDLPSEPPPCPLEVEGSSAGHGDLYMLVGLPGSGKSWLSKSLLARDPANWTHISQDDSGSRSACETEIGRTPTKRVILDRCNTAAPDRKLWLDLASNWCTSPICIWFDYESALCTARAQMRADHPTLPPGNRVCSAVEQMQKLFVRPALSEGFKAIIVIRSFAAAQEILFQLSPPVMIFKFPRTPHLLDLGAATSDDIHEDFSTFASTVAGHVVVTEKIDGANMGFSLSCDRSTILVQNRSHYVNPATHEQFKKLGLWVERHEEDLRTILDRDLHFPERYILFGEWMYATHSIPYSQLPDIFIAYDLYDRSTQTFASTKILRELLALTSIHAVPILYEGNIPPSGELLTMIQQPSAFYNGRIEGVYVKVEVDSRVKLRGKVVRSDFIAGNDHWTRGNLRVNGLVTAP